MNAWLSLYSSCRLKDALIHFSIITPGAQESSGDQCGEGMWITRQFYIYESYIRLSLSGIPEGLQPILGCEGQKAATIDTIDVDPLQDT